VAADQRAGQQRPRRSFIGTSYPGFLAMMAGIDPHPAVKAISPQAPMIDVWMGDDFFHNGAFRQSYGYDYVMGHGVSKEDTDVITARTRMANPRRLRLLPGARLLRRGREEIGLETLPTWKLFLEHPAYDSAWSSRAVENSLNTVAVPTLTVGGYYDQEDMFGPQEEYATLKPHDTNHRTFLCSVHGGTVHGHQVARHLGNLDYTEPIGKEFRAQIEAKFFAHYLKDEPAANSSGFDLEDTASFQTGSNTMEALHALSAQGIAATSLHLLGDGQAQLERGGRRGQDELHERSRQSRFRIAIGPFSPPMATDRSGSHWMTEDQRFVTDRKDVAVWKLPVLKKDLIVTGEVLADIYASTNGADNDLVVKLIDQYPDE
jgi:putative CocE/NonD family hydrolase